MLLYQALILLGIQERYFEKVFTLASWVIRYICNLPLCIPLSCSK